MIGDIQLTSAAIPASPKLPPGAVVGEKPTDSKLPDELKDDALPREQVENFIFEIQNQPAWRREADRAADYYDNNQLSAETVEILKERKQPPLITNIIKPTIDTVLGMEAKNRSDWRVRPEDDAECEDDLAEALSLKLKHAEIESRADRAVSDAYAAEIKAGLGWVEVARETDPFKGRYRVRAIHRREIHWDWRSIEPDLSDARFLIRRRWLELDHAIAMMPQYAELFRQTAGGWHGFDPVTEPDTNMVQSWEIERDTRLSASDWRDITRKRLCLYEIWYRKWVQGYVLRLPNGTILEADLNDPRHQEAIVAGVVDISRATFQKVRLAWYTGPHFLYDVPSPYKHKNFPYVPFFGHREDQTNAPYGLIRTMISPQDEVNARKSKMLWALNSRRVIADGDAVSDHRAAAAEVARADAYIILNKDRKPTSQFRVEPGGELAMQQFQVMQEAKQEIAEASGIHKSMQGQQSGATSGLAINSLVEQGLNTLAEINDNYRYARRLVGEMLFELVKEDLCKGPSNVVIGEGAQRKIIQLNTPVQDPQTGQVVLMNDVAKVKAKIALDDIPSTPTYRMQQLQNLTEITKSLPPNLQAAIVDFVVEATDMPNRHQIADRLRAAAGIQDPEAQKAAAAAQQKLVAQQQQLTFSEQQARIAETQAKAEKLMAEVETMRAQMGQPQGDGGAAALQQAHDEFQQTLAPLYEKIATLQHELNNREAEISAKYNAQVQAANIDGAAKVEAERAKAASMDMLKPVLEQLAAMQHAMELMKKDEEIRITKMQAEFDKRLADATKKDDSAEKKAEPAEPKEDKTMAQVLATLAQTQAALATVMAAPRETKILEDDKGRAIGAVSKVTAGDGKKKE